MDIIDNNYNLKKQNNSEATYYKRLRPSNSEITIEEIKNSSAEYLHNKIRMLNDPYPNAYLKTSDNKKLYLIQSRLDDENKKITASIEARMTSSRLPGKVLMNALDDGTSMLEFMIKRVKKIKIN